MTNIGILGSGSIGSEIATAVCNGEIEEATLVGIYDQSLDAVDTLAQQLPAAVPCFTDFEKFLDSPGMRMVVECASPAAVKQHAEEVIDRGKDLLMASSGALTDTDFFLRLAKLAQARGCQLIVPSGALGGIDAIRAAHNHLEEVTLTTTKTPESLLGAPGFAKWAPKEITKPEVIFDGSVLEAIDLFPANINVGATLSLVGLGPIETKVRIVADPQSPGNVHEVYARGDFGIMRFTMINRPYGRNPRTSYLAILSVLETLRGACASGHRIGT